MGLTNIGAAIFGGVCLMLVFAGVIFIGSTYASQSPITDTYGNTLSPVGNSSQNLTATAVGSGEGAGVWLVLIVGGVLVCMVIFGLYLTAKVFFT